MFLYSKYKIYVSIFYLFDWIKVFSSFFYCVLSTHTILYGSSLPIRVVHLQIFQFIFGYQYFSFHFCQIGLHNSNEEEILKFVSLSDWRHFYRLICCIKDDFRSKASCTTLWVTTAILVDVTTILYRRVKKNLDP